MAGREKMTNHDDEEAPDFEIEEEFEDGDDDLDKDKGAGKGKKDSPYEDILDDEEGAEDDDGGKDEGDGQDRGKGKGKGKDDDDDEDEDEDDAVDEEELREQLVAKDEELAQERAARHRAEKDKVDNELGQAKYMGEALDATIGQLQKELVKAKKEEDLDLQGEIEAKLEKAKDAKKETGELVKDLTKRSEEFGKEPPEPKRKPGQALTAKASTWEKQNPWMGKTENRAARNEALAIDQDLAKEGLNPNTDRYFKELSRRLQKAFPHIPVKHLDGKSVAKTRRKPGGDGRKSSVARPGTEGRGGSGDDPPKGGRGKLRLEPGDRERMRKFDLDPDDKNHVKHFLRAKAETRRGEERRGRD